MNVTLNWQVVCASAELFLVSALGDGQAGRVRYDGDALACAASLYLKGPQAGSVCHDERDVELDRWFVCQLNCF